MPSTNPIHIPLSWVSFTSELDFIKHSYRICPERQTRKCPTICKTHIDPSIEFRFDFADLNAPARWRKHKVVFFNPNVDLFHERIPPYIIQGVFRTMVENPQHVFFLATGNIERMAAMSGVLPWKPNIWAGARISTEKTATNLFHLRESGALNRYLLLEAVSGPLELNCLEEVNWVVVIETSENTRLKSESSMISLAHMSCKEWGIPFYYSRWTKNPNSITKILKSQIGRENLPDFLSKGFINNGLCSINKQFKLDL